MTRPYQHRMGHRRLVRLTREWWAAASDPKVHEVEKGRRYRAMTAHLREMARADAEGGS